MRFSWTITLIALLALCLSVSGCGGGAADGGSMANAAVNTPTTTPVITGASGNTIMLTGGGGPNVTTGGRGGSWDINTYSVKGISMKLSGIAPAAFTVPAYNPALDFGSNLVTITTNTAVVLIPSGGPHPGSGRLYQISTVPGNNNLYMGNDSGVLGSVSEIVTGLRVNAGATLFLSLNRDTSLEDNDANNMTGQDQAHVAFSNDVEVLGTVRVQVLTTATGTIDLRHNAPAIFEDMGNLEIDAAQVFVRAGGSLNTAGLSAAPGSTLRGGDGGETIISANNFVINEGSMDSSGGKGDGTGIDAVGGDASSVQLIAQGGTGGGHLPVGGGVVVNKGKILSNGGEGATGGAGGPAVLIEGNSHVFNTGTVNIAGGKGNAGAGNAGGAAQILSTSGSVFNSGAVTLKGGDGTDGGGPGGLLFLQTGPGQDTNNEGDVANTGVLNLSGGNSLATLDGGDGGHILLIAAGAIRNSGSLIANGGDSQGAGNGGSGGGITIQNSAGTDFSSGEHLPIQPIQISGNIGLRGGTSYSGGNGGNGGTLTISQGQSPAGDLSQGGIQLMGYAKADLSGGSGTTTGGDATAMNAFTFADSGAVTDNDFVYLPVGPIYNELAISARGGSATNAASTGGLGGYLTWMTRISPNGTPADSWASNGTSAVTNKGVIDLSGGSGGTGGGGNSGGMKWYGHDGVTNSGAILNKGGNSIGGTGGEGCFHEVFLQSSLDVVNTGAITTTGGSGLFGGDGSPGWPFAVEMYAGGQVRNSGSILSNGGASTSEKSGNGGKVDLFSESKPTQNTAALISVMPGTKVTGIKGSNGEIWIDWVDVTPLDGTRP